MNVETSMMDVEPPSDSVKQAHNNEDFYELRLYVIGNNRKSQLALENLNTICYKYLAGRCHIEVIDLTKNPSIARKDQIIAIPTLMRKNYPRKIIGDLSNQERVLEILELRISNLMETVNEKVSVEKNSTKESESQISRHKKSKNDLQPYIGSDFVRLTHNLDKWIFSLFRSSH